MFDESKITITTKHDSVLFDQEEHRAHAAKQLGVEPDQVECVTAGPHEIQLVRSVVKDKDTGEIIEPAEYDCTRRSTWALKAANVTKDVTVGATDTVTEPVTIPWPDMKLPRGVKFNGPVTIDGETKERSFISTGNSLVLLQSPEGRAVLAQLDKEHKDHMATHGSPPVG